MVCQIFRQQRGITSAPVAGRRRLDFILQGVFVTRSENAEARVRCALVGVEPRGRADGFRLIVSPSVFTHVQFQTVI